MTCPAKLIVLLFEQLAGEGSNLPFSEHGALVRATLLELNAVGYEDFNAILPVDVQHLCIF